MEMCESLLKADFDEGTEQIPVVRDPTPPPFNFPTRHVKTPVSFSHDHNTSPQNESDFGPAEEDESLLRDVSNNMDDDAAAKDEPKKKANRRKRKKGNKTNAAITKS